jgi:ABC-2 type transport system permease protein
MRLSQVRILLAKELSGIRRRRALLVPLIAFPLAVGTGFPLLLIVILHKTHAGAAAAVPILDSFAFWFVIAGASLPNAIASYSIVGEKTAKSLEPLLATPTTDGEILLGKSLGAFLPPLLAIFAGAAVFMALSDAITAPVLGYLYYPNGPILVLVFAVTPLVCFLSVGVSVLVSSRVTDVRAAQQFSGLLFLPFIALYVAGEIGVFTPDVPSLLALAGLLALIDLGLFFLSRATFQREEILTRWR